MKSIKNRLFVAVVGALLSASAFAYDKNDEQTIRQDIKKMKQAVKEKNGKVVVDMMPEPVLKEMAKMLDLPVADTKKMLVDMTQSMADFEIKMQADLGKIKVYQSKTGRDYVFVPTVTTVSGVAVKGKLFGVKDQGKWSYMSWQEQHKNMVKKAYPDIQKLP